MFSLLRSLGQDAERVESALVVIEGLPPLLTQLTETLTEMATWKEIVLRGLDHLANENNALKQAISAAGINSDALRAELAAKSAELAKFLEEETAEDARDDADRQEIVDRISQLVPAPVEPAPVEPAPEPAPVEPAPEPAPAEPAPAEPATEAPTEPVVDAPSVTLEDPASPGSEVTFGAFPISD